MLPWYPQLLGVLISNTLPFRKNILKDRLGKECSVVEENILRLMVLKIFGNSYICQEFHRWFPNLPQSKERAIYTKFQIGLEKEGWLVYWEES